MTNSRTGQLHLPPGCAMIRHRTQKGAIALKRKILVITLVFVILAAAAGGGWLGYRWYLDNHVFIGEDVYPIDTQSLDLRGQDISESYFLELREKLPGCAVLWDVPFQGGHLSSDTQRITLAQLSEADVTVMAAYFPDLTTVDATACDDYTILETLKTQLPQLEVSYRVSLGQTDFPPEVTELVLEEGCYDLGILAENLSHLSSVTTVSLPKTSLNAQQLEALRQAYPAITFTYTLELYGREYPMDAAKLDLPELTPEDVDRLTEILALLPQVTDIELRDENRVCRFDLNQLRELKTRLPEIRLGCSFQLCGQALSSDTEQAHLRQKISEDDLRKALDLMPQCRRIVVENSGLSNEVLARIREDYRQQTKVVWRVWFAKGSALTDVDVLRITYDLKDDNCHDLIYCEDVRYVDIGHNESLFTVEFVAGMTNLEVIIVSGAPIRDLTPFANCKNLRILELAFCGYVEDISPLVACEKLEMLNIGFTKVKDLSALDDKNMVRLCAVKSRPSVPEAEQQRFRELHPDCVSSFVGPQPYGVTWRYDENNDPLPWYQDIQVAFKYPHAPNNAGWYLEPKE